MFRSGRVGRVGHPIQSLCLCLLLLAPRVSLAICGDGTLDPGEECDDGNLVAGDCCGPSCTVEAAGSPCPDDGNPCSLDECDANGVCTHPTGGTAPCDDGDACTVDDRCGDGVCAGTAVPETCIDPVLCRRARPTSPATQRDVGVDDGLSIYSARLTRMKDLCLPASTTGAALLDPETALVSSRIRPDLSVSGFASWQVKDPFGERVIRTMGPERLLVASRTSPVPPAPAAPPPGSTNHYSCRKARLGPGSDSPRGLAVTLDDALGSHRGTIRRPRWLCRPADLDAPGTGTAHPRAVLMCYGLRLAGAASSQPFVLGTGSQLASGGVVAFRGRELCVPAAAASTRVNPCVTSGDECGLPCCREHGGQRPLCSYAPIVSDPRYLGCSGPTILVDRTHANFHQVTPESRRNPGRFWGFAKLLVRDGYVVRDSAIPFALLFPAVPAEILVIANPQTLIGNVAIPPADVAALVDWVEGGGALLLSIDHPPFERTDALLAAFGLEQFGRGVRRFTFTLANGGLNPSSPITAGIGEVTTFTGTAFRVATPLPQATYEAVLTFPPDSPNNADGWHQGMAIQFGAGRVYISGESGGLTAQNSFGMHQTPDNEQYVRQIVHWLDG